MKLKSVHMDIMCCSCVSMQHEKRKKVAVKGFLAAESADMQYSVSELLEISKKPENLYHAYKLVMFSQ